MQAEAIGEHRTGLAHREALGLVEIGGNGQRMRTQLHAGRARWPATSGRDGSDLLAAPHASRRLSAQVHDLRHDGRDLSDHLLDFTLILKLRAATAGTEAQFHGDFFVNAIGFERKAHG